MSCFFSKTSYERCGFSMGCGAAIACEHYLYITTLLRTWRTSSRQAAALRRVFKRGKGEVGMDEYQVRTWQGWHHHMALSLMVVRCLMGETHRGQQLTPALTLPQVHYGLSLLLLEVYCTPGIDS